MERMNKIKRKWDILIDERKAQVVDETITFFKTKRNEQIGMVAAGEVLDFFLQALVEDVYGKAINDAKIVVKKNCENLDVDLDLLFSKK